MKFLYKHSFLVGTLVVSSMLFGCGNNRQPTYSAGGKVVFADGTPLMGGTVVFRPSMAEKIVTAKGTIQSDGSFQLGTFETGDGAIEGEHSVLICPAPPKRFGLPTDPKLNFDLKFSKFETSGLTCTVTRDAAKNQFTFQVEHAAR